MIGSPVDCPPLSAGSWLTPVEVAERGPRRWMGGGFSAVPPRCPSPSFLIQPPGLWVAVPPTPGLQAGAGRIGGSQDRRGGRDRWTRPIDRIVNT